MSITHIEITKLLELSKLQMKDEEIVKLKKELSDIEKFLEVLKEFNLEKTKSFTSIKSFENLREDKAVRNLEAEVIALAPEGDNGFVEVPGILKAQEKSHEHI